MTLFARGLARKIYVDADADLQLEDFYREVGAPMLADLAIRYLGRDLEVTSLVSNLQQVSASSRTSAFSDGVLNDGADMFVVGKMKEGEESSGLVGEPPFFPGLVIGPDSIGYCQPWFGANPSMSRCEMEPIPAPTDTLTSSDPAHPRPSARPSPRR